MDLSVGTRTTRGEEVARNAKRLLFLFPKGCLQLSRLVEKAAPAEGERHGMLCREPERGTNCCSKRVNEDISAGGDLCWGVEWIFGNLEYVGVGNEFEE